jgi:small-conductance mechanosensitive channel
VVAVPLAAGAEVRAEPAEEAPGTLDAPEREADPIPVGDLPERARHSAAVIRRATARAAPHAGIVAIEREFSQFAKGCRSLLARSREIVTAETPAGITRNLRGAWSVARKRVDGWQSELRSRSRELQVDHEALSKDLAVWQATKDSAAEQRLPEAAVAEIELLQTSLLQAREVVIARRNEILTLQATVSELGIELDRIDEELEAVEGTQRGRLFRLDGPPIWHPASTASQHEDAVRSATSAAVETEEKVVLYYFRQLGAIATAQAALIASVFAVLLLLRRRAAEWLSDRDASVRSLGHVVQRPFSTALLLGLLTATVSHLEGPEFLLSLAWYLLLIPLLRIVPHMISPAGRPGVWLLAGLMLLSGTLAFMPAYSASARLVVLAIQAFAAMGLLWLDRLLRSRSPSGGWSLAAVLTIRTGLLLLAVAFVGEISGALSLSRFLGTGVVMSAYGAALIYGVLLVVRGGLHVLVRSRRADSESTAEESPAGLHGRLSSGLNWLSLALFLVLVLNAFHVLTVARSAATAIMAHTISIGVIRFTIGSIAIVVVIVLAAAVLSRVLRFFLLAGVYDRIAVQRGTAEAISKLLHYSILTGAFLLALGAAGIDLTRVTILAGALGVGVGFGLQNIISNFISGLILLFERPLHVGDRVTIKNTFGEVKDIGIRASTIRTPDGADVVIPNASLISEDFTNWTLSDNRKRSELAVGAAYGTDPAKVLGSLCDVARGHPLVLGTPAPEAFFTGFGESSLDFVLHYWTLLEHQFAVSSELHVAVSERLAAEGIEIPFPQRDLNLRTVDRDLLRASSGWPERPDGESRSGP